MRKNSLKSKYGRYIGKNCSFKALILAAFAGLTIFGTNSVQAEDNFAAAEIISSLPSGENTNSASVSEARIVSEGLNTISLGGEKDLLTSEGEFTNPRGGYLALRVNPSPENLTFANAQVDFQPSPVGRGGGADRFCRRVAYTDTG